MEVISDFGTLQEHQIFQKVHVILTITCFVFTRRKEIKDNTTDPPRAWTSQRSNGPPSKKERKQNQKKTTKFAPASFHGGDFYIPQWQGAHRISLEGSGSVAVFQRRNEKCKLLSQVWARQSPKKYRGILHSSRSRMSLLHNGSSWPVQTILTKNKVGI